MSLVVRAFPVRSRRAAEEFAHELHARAEETRRFFKMFHATESWFFQDTPHGPMVIGVTDLHEHVEKTANEYQQSQDPFAAWFKKRVEEISGVDPNKTPLGPPSELIFDSETV